MKYTIYFILAIFMLAFVSTTFSKDTVADFLGENSVAETAAGAPQGIAQCIQVLVYVGHWAYKFVMMIINEDFSQIMSLVTELVGLIQQVIAECL